MAESAVDQTPPLWSWAALAAGTVCWWLVCMGLVGIWYLLPLRDLLGVEGKQASVLVGQVSVLVTTAGFHVVSTGGCVAMVVALLRRYGHPTREIFPRGDAGWMIPAAIAAASVLTLCKVAAVTAVEARWPGTMSDNPMMTTLLTLGEGLLALKIGSMVHVALLGPVLEEVLLRGGVWRLLSTRLGPVATLLATTVLFGLLHGVGPHFVTAGVSGLLFGWLRWRTGGLVAPISAHATGNTLAILWVNLFGS